MKVFHINSYYTTNPLHCELVVALDRLGIRQVVYVPVKSKIDLNKNKPVILKNGTIVYNHCFGVFSRFLWPLKMFKIWLNFKKVYKNHPASIIHAHTLIVNGLIAYWAQHKYGVPYVVTFRNTDINLFLNRFPFFPKIAWKILENASLVISLSPVYATAQLPRFLRENQFQIIKSKLIVLPNGINNYWLKNRTQKEKTNDPPVILFVGRIDKNKNLRNLIIAMELLELQGKKFILHIVGTGPLLSYFKKQSFKIEVKFFGYIDDRQKLLERYRAADILAVPSFRESFGLVYLEAMSQGLPVIYTKGQGFDGYFKNGKVGFAVNPGSSEEIAERILEIVNNYKSFSQFAYKQVEHFSWDKIAKILNSNYESVLK